MPRAMATRGLAGLVVTGCLTGGVATASDYYWSGTCGNMWHTWCLGSQCSETQYWTYNNWSGQLCGNTPPVPWSGDTAHIPSGYARVYDQYVLVGSLDLGPGGTVDIDAPYNVNRYLDLDGPAQVNNGTITVSSESSTGFAHLRAFADTTISGSGQVVLQRYHQYELANLDTVAGVTLTNGLGHTIRGKGHVRAALNNEGLVSADVSGSVLHLLGENKSNSGIMEARDGGLLYMQDFTLTQSPAGTLLGDAGTVSLRGNATIAGGRVDGANGGQIEMGNAVGGGNTLQDVTVNPGGYVYVVAFAYPSSSYLYLTGTSLVNDGTIRVADPDETGRCYVQANSDVTISGAGAIILDKYHSSEIANLDTADGVTLTNAADHTIRGRGHVRAALGNEGLVSADVTGSVLHLLDNNKSNAGTMEARNGGRLYLGGFTLAQAPAGRVLADGGTVSLRGNATIAGGHVDGANGGVMEVWYSGDGGNTFQDVTVDVGGYVYIEAHNSTTDSRLYLTGTSLVNEGTIRVADPSETGGCYVLANSDVTISGSGAIILDRYHSSEVANLDTAAGVTLTNGTGHTIRGQGHIHAALVNEGALVSDVSTLSVNPQAPGITNTGTMQVNTGCTMLLNSAGLFAQTGGQTVVNGTLQVSGAALNLQGGVLTGSGTVSGSVQNTSATVDPGASAGTLTISGAYTQSAGGMLEIELAGPPPGGPADLLAVSGAAALAGTLQIALIDGFEPQPGQQFTILTASSVTGQFTTVVGPGMYTVAYNPTNVVLTVAYTLGDMDCDGDVDFDDINPFVLALSDPVAYQQQYPSCNLLNADCDGDGDVDFDDINPFVAILSGG